MKKLRIKIYGKVQGVFFRVFVKENAQRLGLAGWVRNENDGTVVLEAEGRVVKLRELIKVCEIGSSSSVVNKVEYDFFDELDNYKSFEILR